MAHLLRKSPALPTALLQTMLEGIQCAFPAKHVLEVLAELLP
jgi:hypothetical protein